MTLLSLRERLNAPASLLRLAGAHNALSAKLVESAGFDGLWASSLEISAAAGVADDEYVTTFCVLPAVKQMAGVVDCPIVVDCASAPAPADMAAFVVAMEMAGASGLCFEDARPPKINSLRQGMHRQVSRDEFCRRIDAAVQSRSDPHTCILARVESLIAGTGQHDALERATAYADAGADALLIHSKSPMPDEILSFAAAWRRSEPLVIVPTTYCSLTLEQVRSGGQVRMVIYANQGLRAVIAAMQQTFAHILSDETTSNVEDSLTPLAELFALQDECVHQRTSRETYPTILETAG